MQTLSEHQMLASISRPDKPYDNARCESFMKTLKREEIHANEYRDLEHLLQSVEAFLEHYYNRCRLHSALEYRSPEEFEGRSLQRNSQADLAACKVTLSDH
jgi:transposase InsO family protein